MSTLNREEYFGAIRSVIGERSDPEAIKFLENMTDTFNALEQNAQGDGVDWKQRADDIDKAWAERYRQRFLAGDGGTPPAPAKAGAQPGYNPEAVDFDDLFK